MKNVIYLIAAMAVIASAACSNDDQNFGDDDDPVSSPRLEKLVFEEHAGNDVYSSSYEFKYGDDGLLSEVKRTLEDEETPGKLDISYFYYTYSEGSIKVVFDNGREGTPFTRSTYRVSDGKITGYDYVGSGGKRYIYPGGSSKPSESIYDESNETEFRFTWDSDGNMVKTQEYESINCVYKYNNRQNNCNIDVVLWYNEDFCPDFIDRNVAGNLSSTNLLENITRSGSESEEGNYSVDYAYTYDIKGNVTEIRITHYEDYYVILKLTLKY